MSLNRVTSSHSIAVIVFQIKEIRPSGCPILRLQSQQWTPFSTSLCRRWQANSLQPPWPFDPRLVLLVSYKHSIGHDLILRILCTGQKLFTQKSVSILPVNFTVSVSWQKGALAVHNNESEFTTQRKAAGTYVKCSVTMDEDATVQLSKRDWFLLLVLLQKLQLPFNMPSTSAEAQNQEKDTSTPEEKAAVKALDEAAEMKKPQRSVRLCVLDEVEMSIYTKKLVIKLLDEISDRGGNDPAMVLRFAAMGGNLGWLANRFTASLNAELAIDYGQ